MLIGIEGNLGSKKKKFIHFLKEYFKNIQVMPNNFTNKTILNEFYKNNERWSLLLELNNLMFKVEQLNIISNSNQNNICLINRTYHSIYNCFIPAYSELEYINEEEKKVFEQIYQNIHRNISIQYDLIIYLKSDINKCFERLIEQNHIFINFDLLESLEKKYNQWIYKKYNDNKENNSKTKVVIIDMEKYNDINNNDKSRKELEELLTETLNLNFLIPKDIGLKQEENQWTVVESKKKKKKATAKVTTK